MGLATKDKLGFYNIKFVALGGDGANTAAKIFIDTLVYELDYDGAYDAKYGSEKRGTPTDVSLKICELGTPVRESGPSKRAHLLAIFRPALIKPLKLNAGLLENAIVIVNTVKTAEQMRDIIQLHSGTIYCLDATKIAVECETRINVPMLAATAVVTGLVDEETLAKAVAKKWPAGAQNNAKAIQMVKASMTSKQFAADGKYPLVDPQSIETAIGYENAPIGGVIPVAGNTIGRNHTTARSGVRPKYIAEKCIHCCMCDVTCADPGSLLVKGGKMTGIDYTFCKGCLRCVAICPVGALVKEIETEE